MTEGHPHYVELSEEPSPSGRPGAETGAPEATGTTGGGDDEDEEEGEKALKRKLLTLGVSPAGLRSVLAVGDFERCWKRIDEYESALEAGCEVEPGLLVDAITLNYPITVPKAKGKDRHKTPVPRKSPERWYLYRCRTCAGEFVSTGVTDNGPPDMLNCRSAGCEGVAEFVRELSSAEVSAGVTDVV